MRYPVPAMSEPANPPPPEAAAGAAPLRTCRCGYDRNHPTVHPEPKYTLTGWFLLLMGATPNPRYAVYRCSRCHQTVGATKDPEVLKEFTT